MSRRKPTRTATCNCLYKDGRANRFLLELLEDRRLLSVSAAITTLTNGTYQLQPANGSVSIIAGQTLTVDAQSVLPSDDPLTTRFQWNFGDQMGKYNVLPGYNAAHIYDSPGNYTLTLTATGPTNTATATLSVSVAASSQNVVYLSSNGTGDGSSEASPTNFNAVRTAGWQSNTIYRFKDGDTFVMPSRAQVGDYGSAIDLGGKQNVTLTNWGGPTAPKPIFDGSALIFNETISQDPSAHNYFIGMGDSPGQENITVENLEFDGGPSPNNYTLPAVAFASGQGLTLRNNDLFRTSYGVQAGATANAGVLMQDNTSEDNQAPNQQTPGLLQEYFIYMSGSDSTLLGNTIRGSVDQNVVRGDEGYSRILVFGNDMYNAQAVSKVSLNFRTGQYAYAADNAFHTYPSSGLSAGLSFGVRNHLKSPAVA